jgi:predicted amidohydrolase
MKVALLQSRGTPGDVEANLAAVRSAAQSAAQAGAELLVTPEAFLSGYDIGAGRVRALALPDAGAVGEIAAAAGVAVACGWVERDGDLIHNAATLFDANGRALLTHRKVHLYGEVDRAAFDPGGEGFAVATLNGVKVGLLICFDVEFPEAVRALALAGAQLVLVPTSLMAPHDIVARTLVPARAAENQLFVAYANRVGVEGENFEYVGQSCVAGPDGTLLAVAGAEEETLLYADVDPAAVARERAAFSYLDERRPAVYGKLG